MFSRKSTMSFKISESSRPIRGVRALSTILNWIITSSSVAGLNTRLLWFPVSVFLFLHHTETEQAWMQCWDPLNHYGIMFLKCRIRDNTADVHWPTCISSHSPIMHYVEIPQRYHPLTITNAFYYLHWQIGWFTVWAYGKQRLVLWN